MEVVIQFDEQGNATTIYTDNIDLHELGMLKIKRASYVEPDEHGYWVADMAPVANVKLGPFKKRSDALQAEHEWLMANYY